MKKRILFGLVVLFADIAVIYFLLSYSEQSTPYKLGYETSKITIQLVLIVLFGGILVQEYNRRRARQDAINEFKRDVLRDLSHAYSDAKGVRRILRAKCVSRSAGKTNGSEDFIAIQAYDEQIAKLNAAQLSFEIIKRELKIINEGFGDRTDLVDSVKRMEKYLGKIVDEYENVGRSHRHEDSIKLALLPRLQNFIAKTQDETVDGEGLDLKSSVFFDSYKAALTIIGEERVKLV